VRGRFGHGPLAERSATPEAVISEPLQLSVCIVPGEWENGADTRGSTGGAGWHGTRVARIIEAWLRQTRTMLRTIAAEEVRAPARRVLDGAELARLTVRSDRRGALQLAAHLGCMSATGLLVWLAEPFLYLLVPAMALHGVTIVTLFAPTHECVHRTAFASPAINAVVGWLAGVASVYNSTYYWYFHSWHHRYTQDPARDRS